MTFVVFVMMMTTMMMRKWKDRNRIKVYSKIQDFHAIDYCTIYMYTLLCYTVKMNTWAIVDKFGIFLVYNTMNGTLKLLKFRVTFNNDTINNVWQWVTLFGGGMFVTCELYCEKFVLLYSVEAIVYNYVSYIYLVSHVFYSYVSEADLQIAHIPVCIYHASVCKYQTNTNSCSKIYKLSFFKVLLTFNITLFYLKYWVVRHINIACFHWY